MDIFNMNFTGNLTKDAIKSDYDDLERTVYNFTVAVNVTSENTLFLDVAYWMKKREEDKEDLLLPKLSKGAGVTVFAKSAKMSNSEDKEGKSYQNFSITASQIQL